MNQGFCRGKLSGQGDCHPHSRCILDAELDRHGEVPPASCGMFRAWGLKLLSVKPYKPQTLHPNITRKVAPLVSLGTERSKTLEAPVEQRMFQKHRCMVSWKGSNTQNTLDATPGHAITLSFLHVASVFSAGPYTALRRGQ